MSTISTTIDKNPQAEGNAPAENPWLAGNGGMSKSARKRKRKKAAANMGQDMPASVNVGAVLSSLMTDSIPSNTTKSDKKSLNEGDAKEGDRAAPSEKKMGDKKNVDARSKQEELVREAFATVDHEADFVREKEVEVLHNHQVLRVFSSFVFFFVSYRFFSYFNRFSET